MSKKKTYYVSHDSNAHQDAKIKAMISVYGAEGYGWYWIMVEIMIQQEGYKLSISKKYDIPSVASSLPNCSAERCKTFIEDCVDEFDLFVSDGDYLWSNSLISRMAKMEETRMKRRDAANARWNPKEVIQEKLPFDVEEEPSLQIIEKEVNLSKVKNIDVLQKKDIFKLFVDELRESEDFKNLTDKFLDNEREKAIDWLKANGKAKKDYRAFFRTWIRNNYNNATTSASNQIIKPRTMHI